MKERGNKLLKFFDKYAGIPLVLTLGVFRKKRRFDIRSVTSEKLNVILLKTAAIGDTVLLSAIAREIKERYPGSSITLLASKSNAPVGAMLRGIDEIVVFDMSTPLRSLRAVSKLKKFHLLLDFASWARINSIIAWAARADLKIGFMRRKTLRHFVFDVAVEHSDDRHELDNYREILHHIPLATRGYPPSLVIGRPALARTAHLLDNSRFNIVFHPFPGGHKKHLKEWPVENWIETGRQLIRKGCHIYISGDRNDVATATLIQNELNRNGRHCTVLCGNFSLAEVAAILYKTTMLITVNTGIMHIGAALNVNLIALHGPTSPLRWGPASSNAVVMKPRLECAPCISLGYEYGCEEGGCMSTIPVEDVMRQAERILIQTGNPATPS